MSSMVNGLLVDEDSQIKYSALQAVIPSMKQLRFTVNILK
jgi:hypothetical protein